MQDKGIAIGRTFQRFGLITIFSVYILILVGGIVRSTGSGMGCPDWPKCFGSWVPPTEVSQLPSDYQDIYAAKRKLKNQKLAVYLEKLGFAELSSRILNDPSVYKEAEFNGVKTWIEYINRLIGVLIGFFIFLTVVFSFSYIKSDRTIFLMSLIAFILVGIEGWIGSIVVSTNLLPGMITLHMMLALVIVFVLVYALLRSYVDNLSAFAVQNRSALNIFLVLALLLSFVQVVLGTQVREGVDQMSALLQGTNREGWLDRIGLTFYIHRSFSILVLLVNGFLFYKVRRNFQENRLLAFFGWALVGVMLVEILSGVGMAYLAIPAFLQPIHLFLAVVGIGIQFTLLLLVNREIVFTKATYANLPKAFSYQ